MINIPDEVKRLLKDDNVSKNFRVHFPNGEREDITNENIVSETVSLSESLCSDEKLKFGLCEIPVLEFETVGVENIKNCVIECALEIYCDSSISGAVYKDDIGAYVYPVEYGTFIVDSCKKQTDMSHRKVIAYGYALSKSSASMYDEFLTFENIAASEYTYDAVKRAFTYLNKININDFTHSAIPYELLNDWEEGIVTGDWLDDCSILVKRCTLQGINTSPNYMVVSDHQYNTVTKEAIKESLLSELQALYAQAGKTWTDTMTVNFNDVIDRFYNWITMNGFMAVPAITVAANFAAPSQIAFYNTCGENITLIYGFTGKVVTNKGNVYTSEHTFKDLETFKFYNITSPLFNKLNVVAEAKDMGGYYERIADWTVTDAIQVLEPMIELQGKFGITRRNGDFEEISLADTMATPHTIGNDSITSLWYDDEYTKRIGRISTTYTNKNKKESYVAVDVIDGYDPEIHDTYTIGSNSMIQSFTYAASELRTMFATMGANISGVSYMPSELSCKGLPWVEVGDFVEFESENENILMLVQKRTLQGIQHLTDVIECTNSEPSKTTSSVSYNAETKTLIIN